MTELEIKHIDGKRYYKYGTYANKKTADAKAKFLRKGWKSVRVMIDKKVKRKKPYLKANKYIVWVRLAPKKIGL